MSNYIYFVGSNDGNIDKHPVVTKWIKSRMGDKSIGWLFPDISERRPAMAFETSLRKIDNCQMVIAVPKEDGSFGESTTWEITYALHTGKIVCLGCPDGKVIQIYDISQLEVKDPVEESNGEDK